MGRTMPLVPPESLDPERFACPAGLRRICRLGAGPGVSSVLEAEVARAWAEALGVVRMRLWRRRLELGAFLDHFAPHARASARLMARLATCREVWLLAVTTGPDISVLARERFRVGSPLSGYLLDRMGSYLADRGMRHLARDTALLCRREGLAAGRRYSPGYGDFSLEAQGPLVALAQAELPELGLTAGCMLIPEKSVTAVLGVGRP